MKRLTFTVEIPNEEPIPQVGEMFDVQNDSITFLDATLTSVEDIPDEETKES